jgi:hypothetical protein
MLVLIVTIVAVDCALVRLVLSDGFEWLRAEYAVLSTLPMVNILAIASYPLLSRGVLGRRFLLGFVVAGLLAVITLVAAFLAAPEDWLSGFDQFIYQRMMTHPTYRGLRGRMGDSESARAAVVAIGLGVDAALTTPPQLLVALAGGLFARMIAGKRRTR